VETLYSTLLPIEDLPRHIFGAPCRFDQSDMENAKKAVVIPSGEMTPFIIREGRIYCFQDLNKEGNPFSALVSGTSQVTRYHAQDWWLDPNRLLWYTDLLNQALHKLTGRRGLGWDKEHKRYYFKPTTQGETREVTYRPLNQNKTTRKVVWQPITKKTGLPKSFWFHAAVSLRFHKVGRSQWCLSIHPDMHITQDGVSPYPSEKKGSRITRKKSRMFNYELLGELQFWRDFLSDGKPRIVFPLGNQRIIVSSNFLQADVRWPGMPDEFAKPFDNAQYEDDLFSLMELNFIKENIPDDDYDEDEDDESEWDE
jgi:hypothetical protein